jgi:hypothetical protein
MKLILNEKKKSSKKLYKVAMSLIKLSAVLLINQKNYKSIFIKLVNVGLLKNKILYELNKPKTRYKISYIIIKIKVLFMAQKFETRRAIKKYIKKRFIR